MSHRERRVIVESSNGDGAEPAARLELLERENAQLRQALLSRVAVEQAKGVLAERFGLDLEQAFKLLRSAARANRTRIHTLAVAVTSGRATPPEISAALLRLARWNGAAPAHHNGTSRQPFPDLLDAARDGDAGARVDAD